MITIDFLENHPETIPTLVMIWHEVLGKIWLPNITIEQVVQRFESHLNKDILPLTFVALHRGTPMGMCSLRQNDGIRPDLTSWLGSLVVAPKYQKQGLGKILINTTKQKAKDLGFKKVYLCAFDPTIPDYYSRLGWTIIGTDDLQGHPVTVMKIDL